MRPASRVPFPQRPCTERVDAPPPARRPTEAYPLGTVRKGNDAGADAAGLECRDLREWSPGGRCAAVQIHRTASHERSPALRGDAADYAATPPAIAANFLPKSTQASRSCALGAMRTRIGSGATLIRIDVRMSCTVLIASPLQP